MIKMTTKVLLLLGLSIVCYVNFVSADEYPQYTLPRCHFEDVKCIQERTNFVITKKYDGFPALKLPTFEPLKGDNMHFLIKRNGEVEIDETLTNVEFHGISQTTVTNVEGFKKTISGPYKAEAITPKLEIFADYVTKGKILGEQPFDGQGKVNITFIDYKVTMTWNGVPLERNGKKYMTVKDFKYTFTHKDFDVYYDNLFDGNKALSDETHKYIKDNWPRIFKEYREDVDPEFGKIFNNLLSFFFAQFNYEELFVE